MTYSESMFNPCLTQPAVPADTFIGSSCALPVKARKRPTLHVPIPVRHAEGLIGLVKKRLRVLGEEGEWRGVLPKEKTVRGREQMCHRLKKKRFLSHSTKRRGADNVAARATKHRKNRKVSGSTRGSPYY